MKVVLKYYLDRLEHEESFKPADSRKKVPTITDLASELPITRSQLHRILGEDVKSLKLDVADGIITAMRNRGFLMEIGDLLEYRPNERAKEESNG